MIMNQEITKLSDLFIQIGQLIKSYEDNMFKESLHTEKDELYSINDILKLYPKLSKYFLTKCIQEGKLPVTWIGHVRHFKIPDIEKLLEGKVYTDDTAKQLERWRQYGE